MMQFWIATILMTLLAAVFVVYPALRKSPSLAHANEARRHQNILVFKDRLAELEADFNAGNLDQHQYKALKAELEASLLNDVQTEKQVTPGADKYLTRSALFTLSGIVTVALVAGSYGLYDHWGAVEDVENYQAWLKNSPDGSAEGASAEDMMNLIVRLKERLEQSPDNVDGWYMLARSSMSIERYDLATDAFVQLAMALERAEEDASAAYGLAAQASFFSTEGRLEGDTRKWLDKAIELNPDEINALGLLGIEAMENARFEEAVSYWSRILELQPDHPSRDSIIAGINNARERMGMGPLESGAFNSVASGKTEMTMSDAAPDTEVLAGEGRVAVEVSLEPALISQISASDTLFVFATAVDQRMPMAIKRMSVSALPVKLVLDDSLAMGPMTKISTAQEVTLVARVSKSGTAAASPGDLEGRLSPVQVGSGEVIKLTINTLVQ
ncbi:MAG: c-type cytochrome biogenesis protein CcmI [Hahellaceae bacterium]|nr:c-type cytochrome biogenesis protein CcmI [Hahellaceae bacterium]